ncbi:MAG: peptidase C15 [Roseibium sp.]|nr:peptidase C15 [Roseibium sp.]
MAGPTKTLLVTGFNGFPGMPVNPTARLMERLPKRLPDQVHGVRLDYLVLPPVWADRMPVIQAQIAKISPDAVVHLGVDGKRRQINIETRAVNQASQIRADAAGRRHARAVLDPGGSAVRTATLPVRAIRAAVARSGAPAALSANAGDYLCNAVFWDTLGAGIPAVFVHVPALPRGRAEQRPSYHAVENAAVNILRDLAMRL